MARWRCEVAVLVVVFATGCSHQLTPPQATGQQLSFGSGARPARPSPTADLLTHRLPMGAAIMVHLRKPLSSATAHAGDPFLAVLHEPLELEGGPSLAAGSELTGRVLESASSESLKAAGYLRLTLVELRVAGKQIPLKTSSLFLKAAGASPSDVEVSPRRIFSLRLTEPIDMSN